MTTLRGLTDDDWTYYTDMMIRQFFENPNIPMLVVYYVRNKLDVSFMFPLNPVHELTFFIREPQEILRAESFRDRVLFGSVNDKVESHILAVVQNVLTPIFLKIETWPDSILSLFNSCLISLPRRKVGVYRGTGCVTILQRVRSLETFPSYHPFFLAAINNAWESQPGKVN